MKSAKIDYTDKIRVELFKSKQIENRTTQLKFKEKLNRGQLLSDAGCKHC